MTEYELKSLKDLPVPAPRAEAKRAAVAAALAAFRNDAGDAQNNGEDTKGNDAPQRLTVPSDQPREKRRMRTGYLKYKIAASVAVLIAAAPAAYFMVQKGAERPSAQQPAAELDAPHAETSKTKATPQQHSGIDERIERALQTAKASPQPASGEQPRKVTTFRVYPDGSAQTTARQPAASQSSPEVPEQTAPQRDLKWGHIVDGMDSYRGELPPNAFDRVPVAVGKALQQAPSPQAFPASPQQSASNAAAPANGPASRFEPVDPNGVRQTAAEPVSTFSLDVDTASYSFARRLLNEGRLPPPGAVRVEEMVNYFHYGYPQPEGEDAPLRPTVTVTAAPWNPANKLVHIAIRGRQVPPAERPRVNLVFLIDVSGSMAPDDRLPMLKKALRMLFNRLTPEDSVAIVTFASAPGVALQPTKAADKGAILSALDRLVASGSTAGSSGLEQAYALAQVNFGPEAVNRIILATDGDFNEGVTDREKLKQYISEKRRTGVFLSIVGVGHDNHNDALMQTLAQNGNGQAVFVDNLNEARKVLDEQASSTLLTIARDAKVQVEFNPEQIVEYRLIGYETRALGRRDFNNDKVDAGEVGSGHTVTAIYEVTPKGAAKFEDELRYGKPDASLPLETPLSAELGFLKLRYKLPKENTSKLVTLPIAAGMGQPLEEASDDVRFSIAVAGFGQLLQDLPYVKDFGYDDVIALAQGARGPDLQGQRAEFVNLVRLAKAAQPWRRRALNQGDFYVSVGSRNDAAQAEELRGTIETKHRSLLGGRPVFVKVVDLGSKGVWRRVVIGPLPDKDAGAELCAKLKDEGLKACLVMRE